MLTEQEKQKIRLEESYRNEVQREFSKEKKIGVLSFLNSNFGAFILSTVIVGGISFLYNQHRDKIEKQQISIIKEEQSINYRNELRYELIHRLYVIETINDTLYDFQFNDLQLAYWGSSIANDPKIKAQYYNFKSFNEKFERWSLIRIVDELYLVEKESNQEVIVSLREALDKNYITIKYLGEQWQDITQKNKLLGQGKLDLKHCNYLNKTGNNIEISRTDLPLKRVWINNNKNETITLLRTIEKVKLALTMYNRNAN
jgi:hypothetical protein